jgi:GNAT superfamily N-acetyltransferase
VNDVRPYTPADREAVREICYVTGYIGEPVDWQYRDRESFADLFTSYYTDAEPESAFVADHEGAVGGYLLGCVDTTQAWNPAVVFGRHLRRGLMFRPGTAGWVWRSFFDVAADAARRRLPPSPVHDERWPAHLHIDLLPATRGHGVGAELIQTWLDRLRQLDVPGCHLETFAENRGALAFFRSMGFRTEGPPVPSPGFRTREGRRMHIQLMVRDLG